MFRLKSTTDLIFLLFQRLYQCLCYFVLVIQKHFVSLVKLISRELGLYSYNSHNALMTFSMILSIMSTIVFDLHVNMIFLK